MGSDNKLTPAAVSAAARGDLENFMVAATQGGIEHQEAMGQAALVGTRDVLPKECPREQLEKLGFVFGKDSDDLFVNVTIPAGWNKKATDHSMWSHLLFRESSCQMAPAKSNDSQEQTGPWRYLRQTSDPVASVTGRFKPVGKD